MKPGAWRHPLLHKKNVSDQDMQLEIHRKTHIFQISACSSTPGPGVMLSLIFIARHNA
jgi:hypothetical protein